jgi:hypothetical protein
VSLRFVAAGMILAACSFQITTSGQRPEDAADGDATVTDGSVDAPPDAEPDAPIDARICPAPPGGCTAFECAGSASCYFVCNGKQTWNTARDRCVMAGGCLATIEDTDENACIAAASQPAFPDIVWFGFRQTGNVEPAGGWGWQCGTSSFTAPNWGDFEPNDEGNDEDCGAMIANGAWLDGGCTYSARYVCEL